jgi:hypothetical protein
VQRNLVIGMVTVFGDRIWVTVQWVESDRVWLGEEGNGCAAGVVVERVGEVFDEAAVL